MPHSGNISYKLYVLVIENGVGKMRKQNVFMDMIWLGTWSPE